MNKCSLTNAIENSVKDNVSFKENGEGISQKLSTSTAERIQNAFNSYYGVYLELPLKGIDLDMSKYKALENSFAAQEQSIHFPEEGELWSFGKDYNVFLSDSEIYTIFGIKSGDEEVRIYKDDGTTYLVQSVDFVKRLNKSKTKDSKDFKAFLEYLKDGDTQVITAHNYNLGFLIKTANEFQNQFMLDEDLDPDMSDKQKLDTILERDGSEADKAANNMYETFFTALQEEGKGGTDFSYRIVDNDELGIGASGIATALSVDISIANTARKTAEESYNAMAYAYVHEKGHLATKTMYENDANFKNEVDRLYKLAKEANPKEGLYGMKSEIEFITEAMINPELQAFLNEVTDPQSPGDSLWNRFLDAIVNAIRTVIPNYNVDSVLHSLVVSSTDAMQGAVTSDRLFSRGTPLVAKVLSKMDSNGAVTLSNNLKRDDLNSIAAELDLTTFKEGNKVRFGIPSYKNNIIGDTTKTKVLSKTELVSFVNNGYIGSMKKVEPGDAYLFDPSKTSTFEGVSFLKRKYVADIQNLDDISDSIGGAIQKPSDENEGFYMLDNVRYWRATSYLGLGGNEFKDMLKDPEKYWIAVNSARIGNIVDEIGKRVFRGDDTDTITHKDVIDFVKKEDDGGKHWSKTPVVSKEEFIILVNELVDTKAQMEKDYGFVDFKTDIILWDHDERVAGEADVIGVKADGSKTVIDLKTRRSGLDGVETITNKGFNKKGYSDKIKWQKQTNLYSDMGENIFNDKYNAPLIVLIQPNYPLKQEATNVKFKDISGDGLVEVVELERESPEDRFNAVDEQGEYNRLINSYVQDNRSKYVDFITKIKNRFNPKYSEEKISKYTERLNDRLEDLQETIRQYNALLKKGGTKNSNITKLLKSLEEKIEGDLSELTLQERLLTAQEFFTFAIEEIEELEDRFLQSSVTASVETEMNLFNEIRKYGDVFSDAKDIYEEIKKMDPAVVSNDKLLEDLKTNYKVLRGLVADHEATIVSKRFQLVNKILKESKITSIAEIKYKEVFQKEAETLWDTDPSIRVGFKNKKEFTLDYIIKKMSSEEFRTQLEEDAASEKDDLMSITQDDMLKSSLIFLDDTSINNPFVQIMHTMFMKSKQRFSEQVNTELQEFDKLRRKAMLSDSQIKELISYSQEGEMMLINEYKYEFVETYNKLNREQRRLRELYRNTLAEDRPAIKAEFDKAVSEFITWKKANIVKSNGKNIPSSSWKNPKYSKLSAKQLEVLNAFKEIQHKNDNSRIGSRPLSRRAFGQTFHFTPKILATTFEKVKEGSFIGAVTKVFRETTTVEEDDEDFGNNIANDENLKRVYAGLDGNPIKTTAIFYRKDLGERQQSSDLFSVYAMEKINGIRYVEDLKTSRRGQLIKDFVDSTKFNKTEGMSKTRFINMFNKNTAKTIKVEGGETNLSRTLGKMLDSQVYSIMHEPASKIYGKYDMNRLTSFISSYTSFVAMSFKLVGATNNWITGNVSIAIEGAGGEFINKKDILKAKSIYSANVMGILGDIGSPVKRNYVNQLLKYFDVQSELGHLDSRFERTSTRSALLEPGSALGLQSMGEHEIHSTLMLAMLNGIKMTNRQGEYLNQKGEVVKTKSEAASVLDSFEMVDGVLQVKDWVNEDNQVYNTFDTQDSMSEDGMASLRALIKDRVVRTQGAFGKDTQALLDKYWYGKLIKQFKKHILPHTLNRFRGLNNAGKTAEEIDDNQKYFNLHSKTEEYGYYTSFIRYIYQVAKSIKSDVSRKDVWDNMTLHERANIAKTTTELTYITSLILLVSALAASIDDDDEESTWLMYNAIYLAKRQQGDAGLSYYDPSEMWRLTESPAAAIRSVNNVAQAVGLILPTNWEDFTTDYESGYNKDRNRAWTKVRRASIVGDLATQYDRAFVKKRYESTK